MRYRPIQPDTPAPALKFRLALARLSQPDTWHTHFGLRFPGLNRLWNLAKMVAYEQGLSETQVRQAFLKGYEGFRLVTDEPWVDVGFLGVTGWSQEQDRASDLLEIAGGVFAAYGIEVK